MSEIITTLPWDEVQLIGRELGKLLPAPQPSSTPVLLSMDFDMLSGPSRPSADDSIELRRARISHFSWQGDERLNADESSAWWAMRAQESNAAGLALQQVIDAHQSPSVSQALKVLSNIPRPSGRAVIADSHVWGAVYSCAMAQSFKQAIRVVSFDRHHDLGYLNPGHEDTCEQAQAHMRAGASCDNWLWGAIERGWIEAVELVCADAMWYDEYRTEPPQAPEDVLAKVTRTRWSQWANRLPSHADGLLLVRSGAWSPPWLDQDFVDLAGKLAADAINADDGRWPKIGALDAMQVRAWPIESLPTRTSQDAGDSAG